MRSEPKDSWILIDNSGVIRLVEPSMNDLKEYNTIFSDCDLLEKASEDIDVIENDIDEKYDLVNR